MSSTPPPSAVENTDRTSSLPAAPQVLSLEQMAVLNRELTRNEIKEILDQVPLYVIADDDELIREVTIACITDNDQTHMARFERGDTEQHFDAIARLDKSIKPFVLCSNGRRAEEVTRIICHRGVQSGVLLFDHKMGCPEGLDIFRGFHKELPSGMTRILQSGTMPYDIEECLRKSVLDEAILKPVYIDELRLKVAQAFLKRLHVNPTMN